MQDSRQQYQQQQQQQQQHRQQRQRRKKRRQMQRRRRLAFCFCLIILVAIYLFTVPMHYSLADLQIEAGDSVELSDFFKSASNIVDISSDSPIDTTHTGNHELVLKLKNRLGHIKNVPVTYQVIDTTAPTITAPESVEVLLDSEDSDILSQIAVQDASGLDPTISISGSYRLNAYGQYSITVNAEDRSGNVATKDIVLKVINKENDIVFFTTPTGFTGCEVDGVTYIDGYLIANKSYSVPSNYGHGLTAEFKEAFNAMKVAAAEDNISLWVQSGFRSFSTQTDIYNRYCASDGQENADTYSARPGFSEHQTGLAADLNIIDDSFKNTSEYRWLQAHCYEYGFILRYVENKTDETGYIYEPWHYRYVGTELATELYNNGNWITLEDHFGITSQYAS